MDETEDRSVRGRRETPAGVLVGREVRQAVAPTMQKLGAWQAEAVKLEVMSQRARASGRTDASIGEAARTMLRVIEMQEELLKAAVLEASQEVRTHSRVTDTMKVLGLLVARLEKVLADVGEPTGKQR
jgi:hypothetical protein